MAVGVGGGWCAQALGMVRQGLGRRFRRWRQRHVLRGQWHTLHERGAPPEAEVEGVELARAAVLQWRAEARRVRAAGKGGLRRQHAFARPCCC